MRSESITVSPKGVWNAQGRVDAVRDDFALAARDGATVPSAMGRLCTLLIIPDVAMRVVHTCHQIKLIAEFKLHINFECH